MKLRIPSRPWYSTADDLVSDKMLASLRTRHGSELECCSGKIAKSTDANSADMAPVLGRHPSPNAPEWAFGVRILLN